MSLASTILNDWGSPGVYLHSHQISSLNASENKNRTTLVLHTTHCNSDIGHSDIGIHSGYAASRIPPCWEPTHVYDMSNIHHSCDPLYSLEVKQFTFAIVRELYNCIEDSCRMQ